MGPIRQAVTCLGFAAFCGAAPAEEAVKKLPPEGSWVRYHAVCKKDDGRELVWKTILKFLGRVVVNGQDCRWVEIEETTEGSEHLVHKLLIPELALRDSEKPVDHVLRYLSQTNDGDVVAGNPEYAGLVGASDFLFLPSVRKNSKLVDEPVKVEYQAGQLSIASACRGKYVWSRQAKTVPQTQSCETVYTIWLHADVPVGFAHAKTERTFKIDGQARWTDKTEFDLEDAGTGAKSAIPEEKTTLP